MSTVSPQSTGGHADGRVGLRAAVSRSALRLQSDRRLVALTRAGSGTAFSVIVERYRTPLLAYARSLLGPDEAEDALQQTFVNALGALRRDERAIELRPWLYRIAHNVAVNALRRSGRNHEQLDEQFDGVPQPPHILEEKLRVKRLVDGIGQLPERQREAIVAHALEGRSYEEIAHSMSATTPVVRQLVHRARTRLRDGCGVLVPAWALRWLAVADLRAAGSERVGEAVAGGAAGAGLLKAGTALLATGAIATGAGGLVVKNHPRAAPERQGPASSQSLVAAPSPDRASGGQPLHAQALGGHVNAKREGAPGSGDAPGRSGRHTAHPDDQGGDRGDAGPPGRSKGHGEDGARHDDPDESGAADTHKASRDGPDEHHGDGSGGGGDPHRDGSTSPAGGSEGSDPPESSPPDPQPADPAEP